MMKMLLMLLLLLISLVSERQTGNRISLPTPSPGTMIADRKHPQNARDAPSSRFLVDCITYLSNGRAYGTSCRLSVVVCNRYIVAKL